MCGIAGAASADPGRIPRELVDRMTAAIEHRGPDEGGRYDAPHVSLAIRRLRIIDLVSGSQPIANEDETVWVVMNGEIYNFQELREELAARGHHFRTRTDTECLVHLYEEHGDDLVTRLRGMFAFALWDTKRGRLVLGRDRLGKKPLVYADLGDRIFFASELQALVKVDAIPRTIDLGALGDYLAHGYVPAPATIYRTIKKLPPAHVGLWEAGRLEVRRYWEPRYEPKLAIGEEDAVLELERRLEEAVRIRLIADVPLGALLSGGVDSSVVVALMARNSSQPVKTFSIGFDDAAFDELGHARRVAERYGTDHHELVVRPDAAGALSTLVRHYGEPYADSSAIPTYYVSKLARTQVTVALNGDGGDEAFAGYDRSRAMLIAQTLAPVPSAVLTAAAAVVAKLPIAPARFRGRGCRFLSAAALSAPERYARWMAAIPDSLLDLILEPDVAAGVHAARTHPVRTAFEATAGLSLVDRVLATDVATYLPGDLLAKMDIASMANSLETRSPLLDQDIVQFAASLPADLKLRGGREQKYLLKKVARRLIPAENIDRPKKGFAVPLGSWLRGDLRELAAEALLGPRARERGYFRPEAIARTWQEHQSGAREHTIALWTLLMFELWNREFVD